MLERKARGDIPFFVNCTSGTTVLGAFDPIEDIAAICKKYNMWLHVDVSTHDETSSERRWRCFEGRGGSGGLGESG